MITEHMSSGKMSELIDIVDVTEPIIYSCQHIK